MRSVLALIVSLALLGPTFGDTKTSRSEQKTRKRAEKECVRAIDAIRSGDLAHAKKLLDHALELDPTNFQAITARELLRQNDIHQELKAGTQSLEQKQDDKAIAAFRNALVLDPSNGQAQEGLRGALARSANPAMEPRQIRYRDADEMQLEPKDTPHDFHFRGDTRGLLSQVWSAFGIRAVVDSSVTGKPLRFDVEGADFATAITIAAQVTRTFYVPISKDQVLIFSDTAENRRNFERLALRTFYVGDATSPQDINDAVTLLRQIFDVRFVTPSASSNQFTVRASMPMLEAATRILEDLYSGKPQVMLEVNVYQVEQTLARDIGLSLPTQFTIFNVNTEARKLLNGANQNLINQLISSGAINQANSASIAALLAGLAAGGQNSILTQPIATFGGGISRTGVIVPGTSLHASLNTSSFQALGHVTLRAGQGDAATYRDGTRYPILNASFSPIFNTPALSQVIANQSFTPAFPSFSYEDLGLTLKATPTIHGTRDVSLKLEFQLRGLGATQLNGVPVITNREYNATVGVPIGETAVLAGMVTRQEQLSLQGLPGLARLPILGAATSLHNKQTDDAELLITITPNLVRDSVHNANASTVFVPPPTAQ